MPPTDRVPTRLRRQRRLALEETLICTFSVRGSEKALFRTSRFGPRNARGRGHAHLVRTLSCPLVLCRCELDQSTAAYAPGCIAG